jgi:hypothetical protein
MKPQRVQELRRSGAAGIHHDSRNARQRSRSDRERTAIAEQEQDMSQYRTPSSEPTGLDNALSLALNRVTTDLLDIERMSVRYSQDDPTSDDLLVSLAVRIISRVELDEGERKTIRSLAKKAGK